MSRECRVYRDGEELVSERIWYSGLSRFSSTIMALFFTAAFVAAVISVLPPFWNGNDDLAMSMIAEGYGLAAYPSPELAIGNVLYGYVISWMPQIGDVSRYSCVWIALTVLAIVFICRALCLLGPHWPLALAVTALVALLPLTFPRFTVLAGMLATAGVLQLLVHVRDGRVADLIIAATLLFAGCVVRLGSFNLIVIVSLVLLPWKELFSRRSPRFGLPVLAVAIAATAFANWSHYPRSEWSDFVELGLPRMSILTDYGVAAYILSHPDLLRGTNYSLNDISLLGNWWFVDPAISDPKALSELLSRVSFFAMVARNLPESWRGLAEFFQAPLIFVALPAMAALPFAQSRVRLALAWLILLVLIAALSVLGRWSSLAYVVYAPVVLLLCYAAIGIRRPAVQWGVVALLVLSAAAAAAVLAKSHHDRMQEHAKAARDLATIDKSKLYVFWGSDIPLQSMYPVFGSMAAARDFRWYGIGWAWFAPYAMAHWQDSPGGLPSRLAAGDAISFFATPGQMHLLSVYCQERLAKMMQIADTRELQIGTIWTVTCR